MLATIRNILMNTDFLFVYIYINLAQGHEEQGEMLVIVHIFYSSLVPFTTHSHYISAFTKFTHLSLLDIPFTIILYIAS